MAGKLGQRERDREGGRGPGLYGVAPVWSPDGDQIGFTRCIMTSS